MTDKEKTHEIPEHAPILPLRNAVLFPLMKMPVSVGRKKSVASVLSVGEGGHLVVVTQKEKEIDEPSFSDLFETGVYSKIEKIQKMNDGTLTVLVQGLSRVKLLKEKLPADEKEAPNHIVGHIEKIDPGFKKEELKDKVQISALVKNIKQLGRRIISLSPSIPDEAAIFVESITDPDYLADLIATYMSLNENEKQDILAIGDVTKRLEKVTHLLNKEIDILELSKKIQGDIKDEVVKNQREYYLREQLKAIQKELGIKDDEDEVEELRKKVDECKMSEEALKVANKELDRLSRMSPNSAEHSVIRTYLETLVEVPWSKSTPDNLSIEKAEEVLDEDHYGLDKVKKRIIEFISVLKLKGDLKGPILCLAGPPGVGKTSLGRSISKALGREYVRVAMGGVRDDAEIRGHRRTYVGAMPGRIIQALKRAKTNNPVILLDEVDKLASDARGDPASALLEVLDPEQNNGFVDHYLDVAFDLSKVMFVCTANNVENIPWALQDRLEMINIPGYTEEEKLKIAQKYLVKDQTEVHGLKAEQLTITEKALRKLINNYTREAGVRNLKREIASVCRGVARKIAKKEVETFEVEDTKLHDLIGQERHQMDVAERMSKPGIATGLAWTPVGGDILFIEATRFKGKGELKLTGKLGEVMRESALAAKSWIKSYSAALEIPDNAFTDYDYHIHFPSGAIPKDGPSAGITILTALCSLILGKNVDPKIAMTGEITLRGTVLPVGGIKEKVLAAKRAGITKIIMCHKNEKDLEDIPSDLRDTLSFHFVKEMTDVLKIALDINVKYVPHMTLDNTKASQSKTKA